MLLLLICFCAMGLSVNLSLRSLTGSRLVHNLDHILYAFHSEIYGYYMDHKNHCQSHTSREAAQLVEIQ